MTTTTTAAEIADARAAADAASAAVYVDNARAHADTAAELAASAERRLHSAYREGMRAEPLREIAAACDRIAELAESAAKHAARARIAAASGADPRNRAAEAYADALRDLRAIVASMPEGCDKAVWQGSGARI